MGSSAGFQTQIVSTEKSDAAREEAHAEIVDELVQRIVGVGRAEHVHDPVIGVVRCVLEVHPDVVAPTRHALADLERGRGGVVDDANLADARHVGDGDERLVGQAHVGHPALDRRIGERLEGREDLREKRPTGDCSTKSAMSCRHAAEGSRDERFPMPSICGSVNTASS